MVYWIDWAAYFEALRIPAIMLVAAVVVAVVLSLWANYSTYVEEKEHQERVEKTKSKLLQNYSLRNAMIINRQTCNPTSGDMRLFLGLYRTPEEMEKYIEESLSKSLP